MYVNYMYIKRVIIVVRCLFTWEMLFTHFSKQSGLLKSWLCDNYRPYFIKIDNDECLSNPCSQRCNNTEGSYNCYCMEGFYLDQDNHTCVGKKLPAFSV